MFPYTIGAEDSGSLVASGSEVASDSASGSEVASDSAVDSESTAAKNIVIAKANR